jgi:GNAT superfamily N-acetyltransferase
MNHTWQRGDYAISTERSRLDCEFIHDFLSHRSYWAAGRSLEKVRLSIENSVCFGLYKSSAGDSEQQQIGFARVVTDYATFAWLADVFVLEEYRVRGLAKWLMEVIVTHPELQGFRRWLLATRDAHQLYRRFGFAELKESERWMERLDQKGLSADYTDSADNQDSNQ